MSPTESGMRVNQLSLADQEAVSAWMTRHSYGGSIWIAPGSRRIRNPAESGRAGDRLHVNNNVASVGVSTASAIRTLTATGSALTLDKWRRSVRQNKDAECGVGCGGFSEKVETGVAGGSKAEDEVWGPSITLYF